MREQSLLPCPFCGGEPEEDAGGCIEYYGHERQDYCISCNRCGAEVYCAVGTFEKDDAPCSCHHDTRKICVDKWNMRHIAAPAVQAEQLSGNTEQVEPVSDANKLGGWIPVSERLPESNVFVLVSNGVWVGQGRHCDSNYYEEDEQWQDEHGEFINLLHHPVTHWMSLPAAPQQETE